MPHHIGFCPSRKAWAKTAKSMGHKDTPYPHDDTPGPAAFCTTFAATKHISRCSVITIHKRVDKEWKKNKNYVMGVVVHESVHAYQDVLTSMEEKRPSSEFEAYTVQSIACLVLQAYLKRVK